MIMKCKMQNTECEAKAIWYLNTAERRNVLGFTSSGTEIFPKDRGVAPPVECHVFLVAGFEFGFIKSKRF